MRLFDFPKSISKLDSEICPDNQTNQGQDTTQRLGNYIHAYLKRLEEDVLSVRTLLSFHSLK